MKPALALALTVLIAAGCTEASAPRAGPRASTPTEAVPTPRPRESEIYSAVIKQLVMEEHTFASRRSPVYVINGAIPGAGKPRRDPFGPATRPFRTEVIEGIQELLGDRLPTMRFITDGNDVLVGPDRHATVKEQGVILSLGPIDRRKDRVHVSNTLWCGGKCSQWLTYVLSEKQGDWVVTGTTGPVVVS